MAVNVLHVIIFSSKAHRLYNFETTVTLLVTPASVLHALYGTGCHFTYDCSQRAISLMCHYIAISVSHVQVFYVRTQLHLHFPSIASKQVVFNLHRKSKYQTTILFT